ncbi:hypothetical protein [Arthrobacter sp. Bz4]|uniref:hypothetical protein n=1 Tax=Arthrobacter sp. Bz4 TaxID=2171979 RepID=UPI0014039820|nr:hypothetical protein [Arthrobacter sp. Bz4]
MLDLSRTALTSLGFAAIIVAILAMHVWMGGHGPSTHGASTWNDAADGAVFSASPMTLDTESATAMSGSHHVQANAAPAASTDGNSGESGQGCVVSCGNESAVLGMCLLAIIVVAILGFLVRSGRFVPGSVLLRGPPLIRLRPLSIPVPSVIQLCISRT